MLRLSDNKMLVQDVKDLPNFENAKYLYLDVETKNVCQIKNQGGLNPYLGDRVCGVAVTVDECPTAYYVPMRHTIGSNLPLDVCRKWLNSLVTTCEHWVNHNIIFDAVFLHFDDVEFDCKLIDTLTLSKVHDSDRFGHGLKTVCREWLYMDMSEEARVKEYLKQGKLKSYADIPMDILGEYACQDVLANRLLYKFLVEQKPESLDTIWRNEMLLTPVLYDMEIQGLQLNMTQVKIESLKSMNKMLEYGQTIQDLAERTFVNSSTCMHDILINQLGLPVLATIKERSSSGKRTDTGRPTFDKDAMKLYQIHPQVTSNPKTLKLINAINAYRIEANFNGLYLEPFMLLNLNGKIHPRFNQVVRTGRMSCSNPNIQQQTSRSKALMVPDPGYGFWSKDYSQVEFRFIAHYTDDSFVIKAYNDDPWVDFHALVAEMSGMKRKPAKTMNFAMAFGQGKHGVTSQLAKDADIIEDVVAELKNERNSVALFDRRCAERASALYESYHEKFPNIKATTTHAYEVCKHRGYVFNAYGRRRHLPAIAAYRAFNSIIQGSAMDLMKERMIAISPRYNERTRQIGMQLVANVHDEVLSQVPLEYLRDAEAQDYVCDMMETPSIELKVPIKVGLGISEHSWAEAAGDPVMYDSGLAGKIR